MTLREKIAEVDDWIEWRGGTCPVPTNHLVDVKWNNGGISRSTPAGRWSLDERDGIDFWAGPSRHGWITAYRPLGRY
jgi:hypothetical protein